MSHYWIRSKYLIIGPFWNSNHTQTTNDYKNYPNKNYNNY